MFEGQLHESGINIFPVAPEHRIYGAPRLNARKDPLTGSFHKTREPSKEQMNFLSLQILQQGLVVGVTIPS